MKNDHVKLTMSLLCCGRFEETKRCLQSLVEIREKISAEILVVDTGCDDVTKELLSQYADRVLEFKWCNDFAKARNFQIENAKGEWFLYLDDDEFFIESQAIIDFFRGEECDKYGYGGYIVRNYMNLSGTDWIDSRVTRLVKLTSDTHFIGKIHERLDNLEGSCIFFDSVAGHYGYCYQNEGELLAHAKRNIPLLLEMIEDNPIDLNWPVQLAQEYMAISDYDAVIALGHRYIDLINTHKYADGDKALGIFYVAQIKSYEALGDAQKVFEIQAEVNRADRVSSLAKATCLLTSSQTCLAVEDFEGCISLGKEYLAIYQELIDDKLKRMFEEGILLNDTLTDASLYSVYCNIIAAGVKLGDYGYFDAYLDRIDWTIGNFKLSKGYLLSILEAGLFEQNNQYLGHAFECFLVNNELLHILKEEIADLVLTAPIELIENLMTYFGEELTTFVGVQLKRKENEALYTEMYSLEKQIMEQIDFLIKDGRRSEAEVVRIQIEDILVNNFGVTTLQY